MDFKKYYFLLPVWFVSVVFFFLFAFNRYGNEKFNSYWSYAVVAKNLFSETFIPFWTPQLSGGYPLYAQPEIPVFSLWTILVQIMPTIIGAYNIDLFIQISIAGIGAALLAYQIEPKKNGAVIAGIAYVIAGASAHWIFQGNYTFPTATPLIPWILLFGYRAVTIKILPNAVIAGLLLGYPHLNGGTMYFFWITWALYLFLGGFAVLSLISDPKSIKRYIITGGTIMGIALGFSAIKLLPGYNFIQLTNRADGIDYLDFIWTHTQFNRTELAGAIIGTDSTTGRVGLPLLFLASIAIFYAWKRKHIMVLSSVAILTLLLEVNSFLTRLVFLLPGFGQTRQIYTTLAVFTLCVALLAGFGWNRIQLKQIKKSYATVGVILVIILEMFVIGYAGDSIYPWDKKPFEITSFEQQVEENYVLREAAKDESLWRYHQHGEAFVGLSLMRYYAALDVRGADWTTGNVWIDEYVLFMNFAEQVQSTKAWGVANIKYVGANQELNNPGLTLVDTFEACESCPETATHLYRNEDFLPLAYTAQKSIFVFGPDEVANQFAFQLLYQDTFSPATTTVAWGDTFPENPNQYDLIFLFSAPADQTALRSFVLNGGILQPDVVSGAQTPDIAAINTFLTSNNEELIDATVVSYEPMRVEITAQETGWLVVSEKFYKFNEWTTTVNGEEVPKEFMNLFSTGVYLQKGDTVVFQYQPKAFYIGMVITIITILISIALIFFPDRITRMIQKRRLLQSSPKQSDTHTQSADHHE